MSIFYACILYFRYMLFQHLKWLFNTNDSSEKTHLEKETNIYIVVLMIYTYFYARQRVRYIHHFCNCIVMVMYTYFFVCLDIFVSSWRTSYILIMWMVHHETNYLHIEIRCQAIICSLLGILNYTQPWHA